ncbi:MAG: LamG-like jellyroll fold domain-containing protein, partial [Bacteroidota bacterium]
YNFNQGTAGGSNAGITTLDDRSATDLDGTLNGFILSGTNSNFVSSEAFAFKEINLRLEEGDLASGNTADFGAASTVTKTFTIQNLGNSTLNLSGSPIVEVSSGTAFIVSTQPTSNTINPNSSLTFEVTYTASAIGATDNGSIQISNDDCDEGTYTINLTGLGINQTIDLQRGSMLTLDGDGDYIEVDAPSSIISDVSSFTYMCWFKASVFSGGDRLLQRGQDGFGSGWSASIQTRTNNTLLFVTVPSIGSLASTTPLNNDEWNHVAAVYNRSTGEAELYVNGELEASASPGVITLRSSTKELLIGGGNLPSEFFTGQVDEVQVWDIALSQDEIRDRMHLTLDGDESGLVAYYQFNNSGASVIDHIQGNNGSFQGDARREEADLAVSVGR